MAIERVIKGVFRQQLFAFSYQDATGGSLAARVLKFELLLTRDAETALVTLIEGDGIVVAVDDLTATVSLDANDLDLDAGHYWWVISDTAVPVVLAHGPFIVSDPRTAAP